MMEPSPANSTMEEEEPREVESLIATERLDAMKKIEEDVIYMSEAQKMMAKMVKEQGEELERVNDCILDGVESTTMGVDNLYNAEKHVNASRVRTAVIALGSVGLACVIGITTTLSILKSQKRL